MALAVAGLAGSVVAASILRAREEARSHPRDMAPAHAKKGPLLSSTVDLGSTITIAKPRSEVFAFWRDIANWPRVMPALRAAEPLGDGRWRLQFGDDDEDAVTLKITEEVQAERLAWQSEATALFKADGSVRFRDAQGGRGTEVDARLSWRPPGGALGRPFTSLLSVQPEVQGRREMKRLKMFMETGEIATARNRAELV
jgi:uncharacterized membrane protein